MSVLPKSSLLAIGLLLASTSSAASAQPPRLANVGTLTCTTQETPPRSAAGEILSCSFKGESGVDANFTGTITRKGAADFPAGKHVLVWSVLAAKPNVKAETVSGVYRGRTGSEASGQLVSQNAEIVLAPLTAPPDAAPTVLEIRLEPAKV